MVSGLICGLHKGKSFNGIRETMVSGLIRGIHKGNHLMRFPR